MLSDLALMENTTTLIGLIIQCLPFASGRTQRSPKLCERRKRGIGRN
uniref:BLTX673 n=1 Tax=Nephila pilipes TaxID=299642 RepID=A0A076L088_NEPPI|nr:BLTX673 [Nephila pilipes]